MTGHATSEPTAAIHAPLRTPALVASGVAAPSPILVPATSQEHEVVKVVKMLLCRR